MLKVTLCIFLSFTPAPNHFQPRWHIDSTHQAPVKLAPSFLFTLLFIGCCRLRISLSTCNLSPAPYPNSFHSLSPGLTFANGKLIKSHPEQVSNFLLPLCKNSKNLAWPTRTSCVHSKLLALCPPLTSPLPRTLCTHSELLQTQTSFCHYLYSLTSPPSSVSRGKSMDSGVQIPGFKSCSFACLRLHSPKTMDSPRNRLRQGFKCQQWFFCLFNCLFVYFAGDSS